MSLTLEQSQRVQAIRAKVIAGTHTLDELKEGMSILRADRAVAAAGAAKSRATKAAAAAPVNTSELLANLKQGLLTKVHQG